MATLAPIISSKEMLKFSKIYIAYFKEKIVKENRESFNILKCFNF
jgi:hypothetical protein